MRRLVRIKFPSQLDGRGLEFSALFGNRSKKQRAFGGGCARAQSSSERLAQDRQIMVGAQEFTENLGSARGLFHEGRTRRLEEPQHVPKIFHPFPARVQMVDRGISLG